MKIPPFKTIFHYLLGFFAILFVGNNFARVEPNLIMFKLPPLPLGIWLFLMLLAGFFLGRAWPKKKKIRV